MILCYYIYVYSKAHYLFVKNLLSVLSICGNKGRVFFFFYKILRIMCPRSHQWCALALCASAQSALRRSALRAPFLKILMKASIWTRVSAEGGRSPIGDGSSYTSQQKRYYVFNTQSSSKTGPASPFRLSGASLREAQALSHIHKGSADAAATIQKPPSAPVCIIYSLKIY